MLLGEAPEQNRDIVTFFGGKRPLYRTLEVVKLYQAGLTAEPGALSVKALTDIFFFGNK